MNYIHEYMNSSVNGLLIPTGNRDPCLIGDVRKLPEVDVLIVNHVMKTPDIRAGRLQSGVSYQSRNTWDKRSWENGK